MSWERGRQWRKTDFYLVHNYSLDFRRSRSLATDITRLISGPKVDLTGGWSGDSHPPTVGRGRGRPFPVGLPEARLS